MSQNHWFRKEKQEKVTSFEKLCKIGNKEVTEYVTYVYRTKTITLNYEDLAGNTNSTSIDVDKTVPELKVTYSPTEPTNQKVTATIESNEEIQLPEGWAYVGEDKTKISKNYEENVTENVEVQDKVGNPTTVEVKIENIDKTPPVVTLYDFRGNKLQTGWYSDALYAIIEDQNEYTAKLTDHNGNTKDYVSGTLEGERANYTLVVTDIAGNTTTIEFGIDKDTPKITGVTEGSFYKEDVKDIKITDLNLDKITYTVNGGVEQKYTQGTTVLSEDGNYTLTATDKAGNKATVNFTIDKTLPKMKVGDTEYSDGATIYTNNRFDAEAVDTNMYQIYTNNVLRPNISVSGQSRYTIQLIDKAGNVSTFYVYVDKTNPTISIDRNVELKVGEAFVEDIHSKISDNYTNADELKVEIYPVNGIKVDSNVPGTYQINYKISDKAGNFEVATRTITVNADTTGQQNDTVNNSSEPTNALSGDDENISNGSTSTEPTVKEDDEIE